MNNKLTRILEHIISIPLWPFAFASVLTQWDMTEGDRRAKYLKKATIKDLKEKMFSENWYYNHKFPASLFSKYNEDKTYFHASIFIFHNVGYMLTPLGYIMANVYQRRIRKTLPDYQEPSSRYID